jgi:hypothetical protein
MDRVYKADSMVLQSLWKRENDSEMAPQAVEISQNGLGDPGSGSWVGESIRRIPYFGLPCVETLSWERWDEIVPKK